MPFPGDLSNPGIKPGSPALQVDSLPSEPPGKPLSCLMKPKYSGCFQIWVISRAKPVSTHAFSCWRFLGSWGWGEVLRCWRKPQHKGTRIEGQTFPLWFECVIVWIHLARTTIMSSFVDTDFKALWKGGMLSITSLIIMGFKWKKLRIRRSFGPGSMTETGAGREKLEGYVSAGKRMQSVTIIHRASPPQPEDGPGSTRKPWAPAGIPPHRKNICLCSYHIRPEVLKQANCAPRRYWVISRDIFGCHNRGRDS